MSGSEPSETSALTRTLIAGRYQVVRELDADRRRTLCEAEHVERKERVLLAVVRADGPGIEQRLRNADKVRSLEHPGLLRVLDAGKVDTGRLYVVSEPPAGTSLRDLIAAEPMEPARALQIMHSVAEAVGALHALGE